MKDLKLHLVKFKKDKLMTIKNYLDNYIVGSNIYWFVIIITCDEYIFFVNNRI